MTPDRYDPQPVDLHVHTLVSDGRQPAGEVLAAAAARGVRVLTITDHSAVIFTPELVAQAAGLGIELPFPGTELSTFHSERRHHLLVYGEGCLDPDFQRLVAAPVIWKNARFRRALALLREDRPGLPGDDEILRGARPDGPDQYPDKRMFGRTLAAATIAAYTGQPADEVRTELSAALERVDAASPPAGLADRYLPTLDVLAAARAIGAVTALAHPLWQLRDPTGSRDELYRHLDEFVEHGLAGWEVASYHHVVPGVDADLIDRAASRGLLRFGGSDYHGNGKSELGRYGLTTDEFAGIAAAVGRAAQQAAAQQAAAQQAAAQPAAPQDRHPVAGR